MINDGQGVARATYVQSRQLHYTIWPSRRVELVEAPSPRQGIRTVPGVQLASLSCVRRRKMEDAGRLTGRTALMGGEYLGCTDDQGFSPIVYLMPWMGHRAVPTGEEGEGEGGRDPVRTDLTRCTARVKLINHGIKKGNDEGSGERGEGEAPSPQTNHRPCPNSRLGPTNTERDGDLG